jgi:hypothetical protein
VIVPRLGKKEVERPTTIVSESKPGEFPGPLSRYGHDPRRELDND